MSNSTLHPFLPLIPPGQRDLIIQINRQLGSCIVKHQHATHPFVPAPFKLREYHQITCWMGPINFPKCAMSLLQNLKRLSNCCYSFSVEDIRCNIFMLDVLACLGQIDPKINIQIALWVFERFISHLLMYIYFTRASRLFFTSCLPGPIHSMSLTEWMYVIVGDESQFVPQICPWALSLIWTTVHVRWMWKTPASLSQQGLEGVHLQINGSTPCARKYAELFWLIILPEAEQVFLWPRPDYFYDSQTTPWFMDQLPDISRA